MNKYTYTAKASLNEVSFTGKAGIAQIMSIFQHAVTEHTKILGVDFDSVLKNHNAKWVITRARFELEDSLTIGDSYTVSTWPLKAGPMRFGRSFTLEKEGKTVAHSYTEWCLLDADTQMPLRSKILTMPIDEYLTDKAVKNDFSGDRTEVTELVYSRTVRPSDLDINGHVNNVTYIKFAFDAFSADELKSLDIKSCEMYYISQCFYGQKIEVYRTGNIIEAKSDGKTVFRCTVNL